MVFGEPLGHHRATGKCEERLTESRACLSESGVDPLFQFVLPTRGGLQGFDKLVSHMAGNSCFMPSLFSPPQIHKQHIRDRCSSQVLITCVILWNGVHIILDRRIKQMCFFFFPLRKRKAMVLGLSLHVCSSTVAVGKSRGPWAGLI